MYIIGLINHVRETGLPKKKELDFASPLGPGKSPYWRCSFTMCVSHRVCGRSPTCSLLNNSSFQPPFCSNGPRVTLTPQAETPGALTIEALVSGGHNNVPAGLVISFHSGFHSIWFMKIIILGLTFLFAFFPLFSLFVQWMSWSFNSNPPKRSAKSFTEMFHITYKHGTCSV